MNQDNLKLCGQVIEKQYVNLASNSLNARENLFKILLSQRALPENGYDDLTIQYFLNLMAMMDTNNFVNKVGVGERESRIYSKLVEERHFHMGHGIGRSGDIGASQPKAAGSSLISKLTKSLTKDALSICSYQIKELLVVPMATGMALTLCLLAIQQQKPAAKYVIWNRIDQKTCLKCIFTANLIPIVIENEIIRDSVTTNLNSMREKIKEVGIENIVCVLSTTSCFAPRIPDNIEEIALICKEFKINHIVNNAYGLQCTRIANSINQGLAKGTVDLIVSSTDKNFMVPVGGALIYGNDKKLIKQLTQNYPGRASAAPIVDLFITLLSMGRNGLVKLLKDRKENFDYFRLKLQEMNQKLNERILETQNNHISMALSLLNIEINEKEEKNEATKLGSILYSKKIMGSRVVTKKKEKEICGIKFKNYGSHCDNYPVCYITVACAIGMSKNEIDKFIEKYIQAYNEK